MIPKTPIILGLLCIGVLIVSIIGINFSEDFLKYMNFTPLQHKLEVDVELLSEINKLGLKYQKNHDSEKFNEQMLLMQEKQKDIASQYLGVNISKVYIKENWNFPFKASSDVVIHVTELRKPVCEVPEKIPAHLQKIGQSETFQIFAKKYAQHRMMIDISDERYGGGMIHYDFSATSDDGRYSASTYFHLDSCTDEMSGSYFLLCKDIKNDEFISTWIKSEFISSLKNSGFCTIKLEPWHQDLRDYQYRISDEHDKLLQELENMTSDENDGKLYGYGSEMQRLGMLTTIIRHYESDILDSVKLQEDLKEYNIQFGDLPDELQTLLDARPVK